MENVEIRQDLSSASKGAKQIIDIMKDTGMLLEEKPELLQIFRGKDYSCKLVRQKILRAAEGNEPVMIEGERGTGKDLIASVHPAI